MGQSDVLQWNLDLTKCQGTGEIGSLHQSRVRRIENLDSTNLRKNNQNVGYVVAWLTISFFFFFLFFFF